MKTTDKYVGLDVHKDTTVIAVAEGGREGEVRLYGTISDTGNEVRPWGRVAQIDSLGTCRR